MAFPLGLIQSLGPWSGLMLPQISAMMQPQPMPPMPMGQPNQFGMTTPAPAPVSLPAPSAQGTGIGLLPSQTSPPSGGGSSFFTPQNIIGTLLKGGKTGLGLVNQLQGGGLGGALGGALPNRLPADFQFNAEAGLTGMPATGGLGGLANVGTGLNVAQGLFNLASGIASGNKAQMIGGGTSLAGTAAMPAIANALGTSVGAVSAVAAPFMMALTDWLSQPGVLSPTEAWQTFGGRLGKTLRAEGIAIDNLPKLLESGQIKTKQDLADVVSAFKWAMERGGKSGGIGGYTTQGTWDQIGDIPGATGTAHEWGQRANFNPTTAALNKLFADAAAKLPGDTPKVTTPNYKNFDFGSPLFWDTAHTLNPLTTQTIYGGAPWSNDPAQRAADAKQSDAYWLQASTDPSQLQGGGFLPGTQGYADMLAASQAYQARSKQPYQMQVIGANGGTA